MPENWKASKSGGKIVFSRNMTEQEWMQQLKQAVKELQDYEKAKDPAWIPQYPIDLEQ